MRLLGACMATAAVATAAPAGCAGGGGPGSGPPALAVLHQVGGTQHRTVAGGDHWYQTTGAAILVLDAADGRELARLDLEAPGGSGPATDLALLDTRLWVLLPESIVEVDVADPVRPRVSRRIPAGTLPIVPGRLSVVDGVLYAAGTGGVVRLPEGEILLAGEPEYASVARGAAGLLACAGRRAYRLDDGAYAGSASELTALPASFGAPGLLLFVRRVGPGGDSGGLMTGDLREVDALGGTVATRGPVRRARPAGGRVWIVTEESVTGYAVRDGRLVDPMPVEIRGAWDCDALPGDRLAVAGSMGRAIVRLDGPRPAVEHLERSPAGIDAAAGNGRFIVAVGADRAWIYEVLRGALPSEEPAQALPAAPEVVWTVEGSARIAGDGLSVVIETEAGRRVERLAGDSIHCLAATGGLLWIGTDRGITVVTFGAAPGAAPVGRLLLEGPVRDLFPAGPEACAWAGEGGFGVAGIMRTAAVGRS